MLCANKIQSGRRCNKNAIIFKRLRKAVDVLGLSGRRTNRLMQRARSEAGKNKNGKVSQAVADLLVSYSFTSAWASKRKARHLSEIPDSRAERRQAILAGKFDPTRLI